MPVIIEFSRCISTYSSAKFELLTCTALQSAADIAKLNMEYADKVLKGEMKVTEVNDYVEAPEINAENVEEYIQIYVENGEISEGGELAE